jgi:hypothetical protein
VNLKRFWEQRATTALVRLSASSDPDDRLRAVTDPALPLETLTALTQDNDPQVAAAANAQWLDRLATPRTSPPRRRPTYGTGPR